jgi:hypothetical protein
VVVGDDGYVVPPGCVAGWQSAVEIDASVKERPCERDCIGVEWRDEVRARRKILRLNRQRVGRQQGREYDPDETSPSVHTDIHLARPIYSSAIFLYTVRCHAGWQRCCRASQPA